MYSIGDNCVSVGLDVDKYHMASSIKIQKNSFKNLLKIGELAALANVLPSTINFYTNEGLIKVGGYSKGGYRLYDRNYALDKVAQIQKLQDEKRLMIKEIKKIVK